MFLFALYTITKKRMYFGPEELWFVTKSSTSKTFVSVQEAVDILESDLIEVLPVVHALTGCDSSSVIASKKSALRVAKRVVMSACAPLELLS